MKTLKHLLIAGALLLLGCVAHSQDIHFSQFNASPMTLNPALTGFFNGDYRLIANLRSQWGSFTAPYKTVGGSAEASLFRSKLETDYLGLGLLSYADWAGDAKFGVNSFGLSVAYKKGLGRKARHALALGFQAMLLQRRLDASQLIFDSQYDGVLGNPAIPSGEPLTGSSLLLADLATGLLWQWAPNKNLNFYFGGAYYHLTNPNQSMLGTADDRLMPKYIGHFGSEVRVSEIIRLLPSILYLQQMPAREITGGLYLQFVLSEFYDSETKFALGAWTRIAQPRPDALIFAARLDFLNVTVGLSYDFNISNLTVASKSRGGYEVSLIFTGEIINPGKRANTIPCPQL